MMRRRSKDEMIWLFYPYVTEDQISAVVDTLRSRFIGQGPRVDQFEQKFSQFFQVPHPVSVNSGTSALETAYDLIGIGPGDEVITTPLTCTATNLPLLGLRKAKIVWADVLPETLCIDPDDVRRKITGKTKAIVQVHLGGIKAEVSGVDVPVVSDAAQALGIFVGDYTCCSFQAIKQMTTIDGGMVCVSTPEERKRAKDMRWFGIDREKKIKNNWQAYKNRAMTFDIEEWGTKRHMNDVAAAMGIAGLDHFEEQQRHRLNLFSIYLNRLRDVPGIKVVDGPDNKCWLATFLVEDREGFAEKMFESYIDNSLAQMRNDGYAIFGGRQDLPGLASVEDRYIQLPIGMHVSPEDVEYICDTIRGGW